LVLEFEALHVPTLTKEVAANLEQALEPLPGIVQLKINLESLSVQILFDESRVGFLDLTQAMAKAGCPLRQIDAALLKKFSL
jgi:copper chaperone CopZ